MEILFITAGDLNSVWQEKLGSVGKKDVIVFGKNGLGLVSYKKELGGETEYFQDLAKFSSQSGGVVISGCDTDTYGVFRHSAVISDKGKILGVSDMVHAVDKSEFVPGGNFRVYDTSAGKIGIIVGEDLFFPEVARVLSLCDADVIICLMNKIENFMPQIMLRAGAFANGVPMALCAENYVAVADIRGEITAAAEVDTLSTAVKCEKDFKLISCRRRGLYRDMSWGY